MPQKDNTSNKSFLPHLNGWGLDFVKVAAALLMVIDHVDHIWFDRGIPILSLLGRAVFPLFCYAVAVAVQRAGPENTYKYVSRMLILALLAEPISEMARHQDAVNVIFTLAFGALFAALTHRMKDWQIVACFSGALLTTLIKVPIEFGLTGVVMPAAILLVLQGRRQYLWVLLLVTFSLNSRDLLAALQESSVSNVLMALCIYGVAASVLPYVILRIGQMFRQEGRLLSKYFLHVFYPLHLFVIWILGLFFFP